MARRSGHEVYTPCTAQTPTDSLCAPACTPQSVCHADGNLYDSCTGALVKSCAAGCASQRTQYDLVVHLAKCLLCRRQCPRQLHGSAYHYLPVWLLGRQMCDGDD